MANPENPWTEIRQQIARLGDDLREMLSLRWQLALLEIRADLESAKRVAIVLACALVIGLTSLPLLAAAAAEALDGFLGIRRAGWLLILGSLLLSAAAVLAWAAWRRFRRRLVGLETTMEELHEDVAWLRQWTGADEPDTGQSADERSNGRQ